MKPVVIATGNPDKFSQISKVLTALKLNTDKYLSLGDLKIVNDRKEIGTMMDRAQQKAQFCLDNIRPNRRSGYLCIIANDTGTRLPSLNILTEESRSLTTRILNGEIIKPGDPINYIYNYYIILLPSKKVLTATAEIPFTYLGNPDGLTIDSAPNTMNLVKAIPGQSVPHSQIPEDEVVKYRLQYLRPVFEPIIEEINRLSETVD